DWFNRADSKARPYAAVCAWDFGLLHAHGMAWRRRDRDSRRLRSASADTRCTLARLRAHARPRHRLAGNACAARHARAHRPLEPKTEAAACAPYRQGVSKDDAVSGAHGVIT